MRELPDGYALKYQNEDSAWIRLGCKFTAIPPPGYYDYPEVVRAIRETFGVRFRPLWVISRWRSPNAGIVKRVHHVLGRYDPNGAWNRRIVPGLVLPTTDLYGIKWKHPIYQEDVLDGLNDDERAVVGDINAKVSKPRCRRRLPRYEPLGWKFFDQLREFRWNQAHRRVEEISQQERNSDQERRDKFWRGEADRVAYAERHDRPMAPKVFVIQTLVKCREIAGGAAA